MFYILNHLLVEENIFLSDFDIFMEALNKMNRIMAMKIAADGEGALCSG